MRALLGALLVAVTLLVPSAGAKNFRPGDVSVCNAARCVPIVSGRGVSQLTPFYFSGPALAHLRAPALGTPYYELRFDNGYATGIVATTRLDRFLSYGVHLERFARDQWYAVPPKLAAELRRLTGGLAPLELTAAALRRSR
jgi:hypothetical protein